ncbi:helicase-related protein [Natronomonas gomsonensis]|uniref:C-terminal helicase domain-containing protein n=1 Tax=Natronomonas gomsonensis TaxID=1046043 RepID=UPI0015B7ECF5|nr:helicase-related protein [Natronomonas gomsonensis]
MTDQNRPDPTEVLSTLKDFQSKTTKYAFQRLYEDDDSSGRFLVADEVGLGKTLVARGVIALAIDHLWSDLDQINIVYICSNSDIARQNIDRLALTERTELAGRLTLHPLYAHKFREQKVNFFSFTPGTSLDLKSSLGRMEERVLLYHLLQDPWEFSGKAPMNVLQGYASVDRFRRAIRNFNDHIDETIHQQFIDRLAERTALHEEFEALCDVFSQYNSRVTDSQRQRRAELVGELRALLAELCVQDLQPNLIILDEFQRFRHLLESGEDEHELARRLFNYSDGRSEAKLLLLSATPYKMYTTYDEPDEDHYKEFLQTIEFLATEENYERINDLLTEYRRGLYYVDQEGTDAVLDVKDELQNRLCRVMARTERLAQSQDRNGMLTEIRSTSPTILPQDIEAYVKTQHLSRQVGGQNTLNYWKSAPYLLNFMDDYKVRDQLDDALASSNLDQDVTRKLAETTPYLLDWDDIHHYNELDAQNSRLRYLWNDVIDTGLWKLLWLPPSIPYYTFGTPFDDPGLQATTKRLIFSHWRVVPKTIASLTSYEAERRITTAAHPDATYDSNNRSTRGNLLRITEDSDDRLTGLPLFTHLYPSTVLATTADPLDLSRNHHNDDTQPLSVVLNKVRTQVETQLEPILDNVSPDPEDAVDERWYWIAPLLLDREHHPDAADWIHQESLVDDWMPNSLVTGDTAPEYWADHVEAFRDLSTTSESLGTPPDDLPHVLAQTALGSPGICSLRALSRVVDDESVKNPSIRTTASRVAWAFRSLFNLPETTSLLRYLIDNQSYWRQVLEYSVHGNLQAVLDEYAHLLFDIGYEELSPATAAEKVGERIITAVGLRTTTTALDQFHVNDGEATTTRKRLRTRFALRFGDAPAADVSETTREDDVREAFNSPFWPHVLVSTSIGQEGLDFHPYCHAVVHWNLPRNPVDLEQREGRVHRFKGHAVRKNLASTYHTAGLTTERGDPWQSMFSHAAADHESDHSAVVPYWIFNGDGVAQIERHLPFLPYTSEAQTVDHLKRSLVIYRMAFGQPRQEDLIEFLGNRLSADQIETLADDLILNLEPPR